MFRRFPLRKMAASIAKSDFSGAKSSSTEEGLRDGLLLLLKPSITTLDSKVNNVRRSQMELSQSIDTVAEDLRSIADHMPNAHDLDPHIKKLANARRKINIVNSILHNCQERLRKLHAGIGRETLRRQQIVDSAAEDSSLLAATSIQQSDDTPLEEESQSTAATTDQ